MRGRSFAPGRTSRPVLLLLRPCTCSDPTALLFPRDCSSSSQFLSPCSSLLPLHDCQNFLALCASGYYTGTVFHRNIKRFIIQGGDPTGMTGTPSAHPLPSVSLSIAVSVCLPVNDCLCVSGSFCFSSRSLSGAQNSLRSCVIGSYLSVSISITISCLLTAPHVVAAGSY
jgi:Cyclophilin type peptidyl-prolyl cis-trans isomerase/CLD